MIFPAIAALLFACSSYETHEGLAVVAASRARAVLHAGDRIQLIPRRGTRTDLVVASVGDAALVTTDGRTIQCGDWDVLYRY